MDWEELAALYRAAPLGDKKPDDLKLVFTNSMFRCFAFASGKVAAAGRVLADGRDCACLCDIAVLPSHQGQGLGKGVMVRLIERSKSHRKIILYAVPGREPLYRGFGFRRMSPPWRFSAIGQEPTPRATCARCDPHLRTVRPHCSTCITGFHR